MLIDNTLIKSISLPPTAILRKGRTIYTHRTGWYEGTRKNVELVTHPTEGFDRSIAFVTTPNHGELPITGDLLGKLSLPTRVAMPIVYQAADWRHCITFPTVDSSFGASLICSLREARECPQILFTVRDKRVGPMGWSHEPRPASALVNATWEDFPTLDVVLEEILSRRIIADIEDPRLK